MADIRMSLADAATALGLAPNSVRSRFKAGKLRGERDNQGKIWVWLADTAPPSEGSKPKASKPSIEGFEQGRFEALEAHLRTLTEQLALAQSELAVLRPRASAADRLEAEVAGLEALRDEVRADRDHWRKAAEAERAERLALSEELLLTDQRPASERSPDAPEAVPPSPPKGFWSRLFGRQGDTPSEQ